MKGWFLSLQPRERNMVLACAAVIFIALVYFAVWKPTSSEISLLQNKVESHQKSLAWMKSASQKIQGIRNQNPNRRMADSRSLLAVVDSGLTKANLKNAVQRMEPDGNQNVKLWLNSGTFNDLVKMLGELEENNGVLIKSINLTPVETVGLVDARLTLTTQQ